MSAVFKKRKVIRHAVEQPMLPEVADRAEVMMQLERKRKKRMGAVSQILSEHGESNYKKKLGD